MSPSHKKRSSLLTCPRHPGAPPIPPTLVNSPYLSSSAFRRKTSTLRWPSQAEDEWLRDMVPIDAESKSEGSTPSPTSSESSYGFPPSPLLRPRSASPDTAKRTPAASSSS